MNELVDGCILYGNKYCFYCGAKLEYDYSYIRYDVDTGKKIIYTLPCEIKDVAHGYKLNWRNKLVKLWY